MVDVAAVTSTSTIAPGSAGPDTLTVTFCRVRPRRSRSSRLAPSTSTSARRPTQEVRLFSASRWLAAMRRCTRSRLTSADSWAGKIGRGGAATRRVHERVRRVERRRLDEVQRLGELLFGLTWEPGDEIGGDAHVRHGLPEGTHAAEEPLGRVAAPHRREDAVGTRLRGQVDVLAHAGRLGDGSHKLVREILGMRRHEADAVEAVDGVQGAQQRGKAGYV